MDIERHGVVAAVANLLEITICTNITSTTAKKTSQNSQKLNFITEEMLDARLKLKTKTTRTQHTHTFGKLFNRFISTKIRVISFIVSFILFWCVAGIHIQSSHSNIRTKFELVQVRCVIYVLPFLLADDSFTTILCTNTEVEKHAK